jgi:glycosyltransferase involved in cell wall biosynthesis
MSSTSPLVSIITPSYNQAQFVEATITSVLNQSYQNIEYIIIDGGSSDLSSEIIQKYQQHLAYWISEPDSGQANAINKGLIRATGDYLGWINSDDTLTPGAVSRIVTFLEANPEADLAYGSINFIDFNGIPTGKTYPPRGTPIFSVQTMIGDRKLVQPGSFWRRSIMNKVGFLNETYHHVFDYEFWIRIIFANGIFAQVPGDPLANFRLSPGSKTVSNIHKSGEEELRLLTELLANPHLSTLDIPPQQLHRQSRKAYAVAYLKIFKGLSQQPRQYYQAWRYLFAAIRAYPVFLVTRFPLILSVVRYQLRI